MSSSDIWDKIKNQLKSYPIDPNNRLKLKSVVLSNSLKVKVLISGNDFILLVPSRPIKSILEKEFLVHIKQAIHDVMQKAYDVSIEIQSQFALNKKLSQVVNNNDLVKQEFSQNVLSLKKTNPIKIDESAFPPSNKSFGSFNSNQQLVNNSMLNTSIPNSNFVDIDSSDIENNKFYRVNSIQEGKVFDNFIEGPTNKILCTNGKEVAKNPGDPVRNPFFAYGDTGLGKTHILFAIGNEVLKQYPNKKVMYVTFDQFYSDFIIACEDFKKSGYDQGLIKQFKYLYRNLDVLLIDDMQELERFKNIENEFIALMNDIINSSNQIVFAASCHPHELRKVDERLRNRFLSGVSIKVEPPDLDTRKKIIEEKSKEMGVCFDKQCVDFLANKFQTNVRVIEGHIKTIAAYVSSDTKVTLDVVRDALRGVLKSQAKLITIDNIKQIVADYFKITVKDIEAKNRHKNVAYARMMAMKIARELTGESFPSIGKKFGGKDHSTVMHADKKISALINRDEQVKSDYEVLKAQLA
ncbi:MAG: chromosomal replication initiator protein DnaA [Succinivibrionaceae bacterium]